MATPNCPKESRPEHSLPNGRAGSMAPVKRVTNAAPVKTPRK